MIVPATGFNGMKLRPGFTHNSGSLSNRFKPPGRTPTVHRRAFLLRSIASGSYIKGARVNVLGLTFKENCADLRNSKVVDIIRELQSYGIEVFVHDPEADAAIAMREYGVSLSSWDALPRADAVVAAVAHQSLQRLSAEEIGRKLVRGGSFVDVKSGFDASVLRAAGLRVWRL